jgi:hypothetical protein
VAGDAMDRLSDEVNPRQRLALRARHDLEREIAEVVGEQGTVERVGDGR